MEQNTPKQTRWMAVAGLALAMSIFGSIGFVAAKTGLHAFELVFVRCVCATLFLGIAWLVTGKFANEPWNRREMGLVLLCGIFLVLNWIFLFRAFEELPVTVAICIYYLAPVFVLLLGSIVYREPLTFVSISSVVASFIGTLFIIGIGNGIPFSHSGPSGLIRAFLAALFYALLTLVGKGIKSLSPYTVSFIQTLLGVVLLLPFVKLEAFHYLKLENWIAIIIIGSVHTGLVYYLFFGSVRLLPARITSGLVFLDPGVAILLDILLTGYRPTPLQIFGIALIFIGMSLTLYRSKRNLHQEERKYMTTRDI